MPEPTAAEVRRRVADAVITARRSGALIDAASQPVLPEGDAYAVQDVVVGALRAGQARVGWKLGYTSEAMRAQMGVASPNLGPLFAPMLREDGAVVSTGVVQPKVEPEIAAVIGDDGTVREWRAALEVVDSVWEGYRFTWALNTADGSSAALVVLGGVLPEGDLRRLPVSLALNGAAAQHGWGRNAMGDPREALAWLEERLTERGDRLQPGDVVITGGLTAAVALEPGDTVEALVGSASVRLSRARA